MWLKYETTLLKNIFIKDAQMLQNYPPDLHVWFADWEQLYFHNRFFYSIGWEGKWYIAI